MAMENLYTELCGTEAERHPDIKHRTCFLTREFSPEQVSTSAEKQTQTAPIVKEAKDFHSFLVAISFGRATASLILLCIHVSSSFSLSYRGHPWGGPPTWRKKSVSPDRVTLERGFCPAEGSWPGGGFWAGDSCHIPIT